MNTLQWSAPEYEDKERSTDWFWALGIIIVTSSITSIIFDNYFFATLLLLSGILLGFFATKKPELINYELNRKGLQIHTSLFPYSSIKSFWVQIGHSEDTHIKPLLFIKSGRVFLPVLQIPIPENLAEAIHTILSSQNISEEEMKEHPSEKIMDVLGF